MRAPRPISPIPVRFVSLPSFEGSGRQNARPPPSLSAASLYYYPRITTIPSDRTPVFITTSTQPRPSPLFSFLFFFPPVCVEQPSMNRRWDCIGVFWLDCHRVCSMDFLFFFFLFVSSRFSRFIVVYSFFFWTTWRGHLKKWHRYSLRGTSSITDLLIFFFFFFLALRSYYFQWIYCNLVFKNDF